MRTPTTVDEQMAWHRAAIAGLEPPMHVSEPQCGWYRRRIVKDGPWVAAVIWLEPALLDEAGELAGDEIMRCMVGDKDRTEQLLDEWAWLCAEPITKENYDYLLAYAAWARVHSPLSPEAQPHLPIIPRNLPELF